MNKGDSVYEPAPRSGKKIFRKSLSHNETNNFHANSKKWTQIKENNLIAKYSYTV